MDALQAHNAVMDYIEEHLTGELDHQAMARIAGCSAGLYPRIFAALAGLPLSAYIRQRRLTVAAQEIMTTDQRIIDVALRYGYESADAFTAAFRRLHGVTPTAARQLGVAVKSYPKVCFTLSIQGGAAMDYRKETLPPMTWVGVSRYVNAEQPDIDSFWEQVTKDGTSQRLLDLDSGLHGLGLGGVCCNEEADTPDRFRYLIGVEAAGPIEGWETVTIPASTWLVFTCTGPMPGAIQEVWKRIHAEFLPGSRYRLAGTPDLEVYSPGDNSRPDYHSEIWLPVVEAAE
jgi:AraC family transcriptional regulator